MVIAQPIISGSLGQLTTSDAVYYTQPGSTANANSNRTIIQTLTLTNTSASPVDVWVYVIPFGSSPGNAFLLGGSPITVAVGQSLNVVEAERKVLTAGGTIQARASADTAVSIMASGTEITA